MAWTLFLALSPLLALAAQVPLMLSTDSSAIMNASWKQERKFEFKTGNEIFSPIDLIELARPGAGIANDVGDVLLVPVSKYSFKDKELVCRVTVAEKRSDAAPHQKSQVYMARLYRNESATTQHPSGQRRRCILARQLHGSARCFKQR